MTGSSDPLAQFRRKGQESSIPAERPALDKRPYEAFRVSSEEKRFLEIRQKFPEPAEAISNMTLSSANGEWRYGTGVTLEYSKAMVVDIKGENLGPLFKAIQEWKVEFIAEFDPEEHELPTDPKAPLIKSITIHTERPEPPPPASQRH